MTIAGIGISPRALLLLSVVGGFALGVLLSLVIGSPIGVLAIVVGPLFARAWVQGRLRNRRKTFADQLPENLDVISSGLRSGHSFTGALAVCVDDAVDPAKTEFRRVIADEQLGIAIDEALHVTGRGWRTATSCRSRSWRSFSARPGRTQPTCSIRCRTTSAAGSSCAA